MAFPTRVFSVCCALIAFAAFVKNLDGPAWAVEKKVISAAKIGASQAGRIFGRIDEIGSSPLPNIGLSSDTKRYSGTVISAYPEDLLGDWGGQVKIFSYKVSDSYRSLDPKTTSQSIKILRPGRSGASNFCFHKDSSGKIVLDPVRVSLTVPLNETQAYAQMAASGQHNAADIARLGSQMTPAISIDFESIQTNANSSGVGGGQFNTKVVKSTIRQLGPEVFEKQIFTRSGIRLPSNAAYRTISENVIWFKVIPADKNLYVRICGLEYSEKGQLLSKLVLSGTLVKGRRVETDPQVLIRQKNSEMQSEINRLQGELNQLRKENQQNSQ